MSISLPEQKTKTTPNPPLSSEKLKNQMSNLNPGLISVLTNQRFLILWGGQICSQIADKIYLVLMIAIITNYFQTTNQSISGWVSAIMIAFTIPAILFGSVAGVYVDRWSKKTVLVISNLARGVLVLSLPPILALEVAYTNQLGLPVGFWFILLITFLVSTLTQFFSPAEQAAIPLIIKRDNLLSANSIYITTMMGVLIIGFAVGDPLLELANNLGDSLGLTNDIGGQIFVGVAYLLAGLFLLLLVTGETKIQHQKENPHIWQDIKEGITYVQKNKRVYRAIVYLVILFSVFAALAVLAVRLAETIPGIKAEEFGILLAACGVGLGISAIWLGSHGEKISRSRLILWSSLGMAISLIGLSLFTYSLWLELLMSVFLGAFAACIGIPMQTTVQAETPPEMRGKVFGLQNNLINIALSLPLALAGVAETIFGLKSVLLGLAGVVMIISLIQQQS